MLATSAWNFDEWKDPNFCIKIVPLKLCVGERNQEADQASLQIYAQDHRLVRHTFHFRNILGQMFMHLHRPSLAVTLWFSLQQSLSRAREEGKWTSEISPVTVADGILGFCFLILFLVPKGYNGPVLLKAPAQSHGAIAQKLASNWVSLRLYTYRRKCYQSKANHT